MRSSVPGAVLVFILLSFATGFAGDLKSPKQQSPGTSKPPDSRAPVELREASREALEKLAGLVGEWRGVARPKRNSTEGAWFEKGEWLWELKKDHVGLRFNVKDGKQIVTALLTFDPAAEEYRLEAELADKARRQFAGRLDGNRLTLMSAADESGRFHQVDIKLLSEKRTVLLYQSRLESQQQFALVAEVGYTREGTKLAEEGGNGPECIVTGGKGTMSTVYKGQTYWFCCTGCRDAFDDDPEAVLKEAAARAAKKKAASEGRKP